MPISSNRLAKTVRNEWMGIFREDFSRGFRAGLFGEKVSPLVAETTFVSSSYAAIVALSPAGLSKTNTLTRS